VIEPNPAGGANFVTTYSYDGMNHLVGVTMTRPEGTQTRSFVYTGPDLTSATNPENGSVSYTYNAAHQVTTRTDAKNQVTQYTYDSYGRLTGVGGPGFGYGYTYDTPIDPNFGATYTAGRVAAVSFGSGFTYQCSYNPAGRVITQRLVAPVNPSPTNPNVTMDATYVWDGEGRLTSRTYPTGTTYGYQYDLIGRLSKLTEQACNWAGSVCEPYTQNGRYRDLRSRQRDDQPLVFRLQRDTHVQQSAPAHAADCAGSLRH